MLPLWLFDCDNTLYPGGSGFFERVDAKIDRFMSERMGLDGETIRILRRRYKERYGVTLAGLMAEWAVDPDEYLPYVHDVPIDDVIAPDPALGKALLELPGERVIFTNGSTEHAERVLDRLGVRDAFTEIYDIAFMEYRPKPFPHGYQKLLETRGVPPGRCRLIDDWEENLKTGRKLGMATVLVGGEPRDGHAHVKSPHFLPGLDFPPVP